MQFLLDIINIATFYTTVRGGASKSLSNCGTEYYRSPELRSRQSKITVDWKKVDIFALGVIFFELCWIIPNSERDKVTAPIYYICPSVCLSLCLLWKVSRNDFVTNRK